MTHAALARLSPEAALREIEGASSGSPPRSASARRRIAFPYGYPSAAGPREAKLAERAGLAASFTTQPGYVPASGSRHGLPRVSVNGLFQHVRYLEMLLTPGLWKLRNKIRESALSFRRVAFAIQTMRAPAGITQINPATDKIDQLRQPRRARQLCRGNRHRRQRIDADEGDEHDAPDKFSQAFRHVRF